MKVVVFDMDGVIFDTEKLILNGWDLVGKKYHIQKAKETCQKCFGTTNDVSRDIFKQEYGADFEYDEYKEHVRTYFNDCIRRDGMPLKSGVVEILSYLRENNYKIGLASSTRVSVVRQELEMANIIHFFDDILGGDLLKRSKPYPDIYLKSCDNLKVDSKYAYAIEDSYNGIRAAHRAGMKAIMVPDMMPPTNEMKEISHSIQKNLFEVIQFLETKE